MIPVLNSSRLIYKPLSLEHCTQQYVDWLNDPEVYRYLETGGDYTTSKLKDYLGHVVARKDMLFWAIHIKTTGLHIGNIKIDPISKRHGTGEYGIMMGERSEWRKGYAKEASERIIKYCFEEAGIRKITLGVVAKNAPAVRLYESLGFQVEGVYKKHGFYEGEYLDLIRMAIFNPAKE